MVSSTFWTEYHFTGLALILGGLLFLVGAFMPLRDKKGAFIYGLPPREWLNVIFDHPRLWQWANILYSLAGLGLLGFTGDAPPLLHHLMPIMIGILLLL